MLAGSQLDGAMNLCTRPNCTCTVADIREGGALWWHGFRFASDGDSDSFLSLDFCKVAGR